MVEKNRAHYFVLCDAWVCSYSLCNRLLRPCTAVVQGIVWSGDSLLTY